MTRLREIRARGVQQDTDADLRGLGGEDLLTRSSPYACLSVEGSSGWSGLSGLLARHDLVEHGSRHPGVTHLTCRCLLPGAHKEQAVRIFVAALDLHRLRPRGHLFLSEFSGLHIELHKAVHGKNASNGLQGPDARIEPWLERPGALSLDPVITWHLHQAGFALERQERLVHLDGPDIDAIFDAFTRSIRELSRHVRAA